MAYNQFLHLISRRLNLLILLAISCSAPKRYFLYEFSEKYQSETSMPQIEEVLHVDIFRDGLTISYTDFHHYYGILEQMQYSLIERKSNIHKYQIINAACCTSDYPKILNLEFYRDSILIDWPGNPFSKTLTSFWLYREQ